MIITILMAIFLTILQISLSKKENKWLGIIPSIIWVFFPLVLSLVFLNLLMGNTGQATSITFEVPEILIYNIYAVFLLILHYIIRRKRTSRLDKMKINDL